MSALAKLRRIAIFFLPLALLNASGALYILFSGAGLSESDATHTFSVTFKGGAAAFYTPMVGWYIILSGVAACIALGLLLFLHPFSTRR